MIEAFFDEIEKNLITILNESQKEVKIAVSWFTNPKIYELLINKLADNISVTIITNNDEINNNSNSFDFNIFIKNGGKLYFMNNAYFMHDKFMIIDEINVITGSYNYTKQAENINIENIIAVRDNKEIASQYSKEFSRLLNYSIAVDYFERIERNYNNTITFKKLPKNTSNKTFEIIKVDLEKNILTLKCENNKKFYLNVNKVYEVGHKLTLLEPIQIESKISVKNSWLNVYNWIRNPKIIE